jgi:hypothetical protein
MVIALLPVSSRVGERLDWTGGLLMMVRELGYLNGCATGAIGGRQWHFARGVGESFLCYCDGC